MADGGHELSAKCPFLANCPAFENALTWNTSTHDTVRRQLVSGLAKLAKVGAGDFGKPIGSATAMRPDDGGTRTRD